MKIKKKDILNILQANQINKTGYEKYLGKNVFLRTVTHHYTGNVIEVTNMTMTLNDAAWIADDGRFNEAMKDSANFSEVEPYSNPITINLYSILDITELNGKLPREVK
jgi:hypothetical protein